MEHRIAPIFTQGAERRWRIIKGVASLATSTSGLWIIALIISLVIVPVLPHLPLLPGLSKKASTSQRIFASAGVRSKSAMVENSHSDSLNPGAKSGEVLPQRGPSTLPDDSTRRTSSRDKSNQGTIGAKFTPNPQTRDDSSSITQTSKRGDTRADPKTGDNRETGRINPSTSGNKSGEPNGMNNPKNESAPVEEPERHPPTVPAQKSNGVNQTPSETGDPPGDSQKPDDTPESNDNSMIPNPQVTTSHQGKQGKMSSS